MCGLVPDNKAVVAVAEDEATIADFNQHQSGRQLVTFKQANTINQCEAVFRFVCKNLERDCKFREFAPYLPRNLVNSQWFSTNCHLSDNRFWT